VRWWSWLGSGCRSISVSMFAGLSRHYNWFAGGITRARDLTGIVHHHPEGPNVGKPSARNDDGFHDRGKPAASGNNPEGLEQNVLKFAEQLGWLVGTVQAKSEGWLDRRALSAQVERIRDSAADLMKQLQPDGSRGSKGSKGSRGSTGSTVKALPGNRGPVDGTGKRHRPAPPSVRGAKHSDERVAKETMARRMSRRPRG